MQTTSRQPDNKTVAVYVITAGETPFLSQTLRAVNESTYPFNTLTLVNTTADKLSAETLAIGKAKAEFSLLELPGVENLGEALSQALTKSTKQSEYLWILSDHTAPAADCLAALVETADNDEEAPVVGGKSFAWNSPTRLIATGISATRKGQVFYPLSSDEIDQGQYDNLRDVLAVYMPGALVRTQWWHKLRGTLNFLDVQAASLDFCQRTYLAGKHVIFAPQARIYVAGGDVINAQPVEKSLDPALSKEPAAAETIEQPALEEKSLEKKIPEVATLETEAQITPTGARGSEKRELNGSEAAEVMALGSEEEKESCCLDTQNQEETPRSEEKITKNESEESGREALFSAGLQATEPFNLLKTQENRYRNQQNLKTGEETAPQDHVRLSAPVTSPVQETWIRNTEPVHSQLLKQLQPTALSKRKNEMLLRSLSAPRFIWGIWLGYYFVVTLITSLLLLLGKELRKAGLELVAYFNLWSNAAVILKARRERFAQAKVSTRVLAALQTPLSQLREAKRIKRKIYRDQDKPELKLEALVQKQLFARREKDRLALMSLAAIAFVLSLVLWYINRQGINGGYWSFLPDNWGDLWSGATTWWLPSSTGTAGVPDPILLVLSVLSVPLALLGLSPNYLTLGVLNLAPMLVLGSAWVGSSLLSRTTAMRTWLSVMWLASPLLWIGIIYGDLNSVIWHIAIPLAVWASIRGIHLGEPYRFAGVSEIVTYRPGGSSGVYAGIAALTWVLVAATSPFSLVVFSLMVMPIMVLLGVLWSSKTKANQPGEAGKLSIPSRASALVGLVLSLIPAWLLLIPGLREIDFTKTKTALNQLYAYALQVPVHEDQPTIAQLSRALLNHSRGITVVVGLIVALILGAALIALARGRNYLGMSFAIVVLAIAAAGSILGAKTTWVLIPLALVYGALLSIIALGLDYLGSGWRYRDYHNLRGSLRLALQQDSFYQNDMENKSSFFAAENETLTEKSGSESEKIETSFEAIPTDYTEKEPLEGPLSDSRSQSGQLASLARLKRYRLYLGLRYLGTVGAFIIPLGCLSLFVQPIIAYNALHDQTQESEKIADGEQSVKSSLAFLPQGPRPNISKVPGTFRIFSQDIPRSRAILIEKKPEGEGYQVSLWRFPAQSSLGSNALIRSQQNKTWNETQMEIADLGVEIISGNIKEFNQKALALGAEQVYLERSADPEGKISAALESDPYIYEVKQSGRYSQWQIDAKAADNRYLPARLTISDDDNSVQILKSKLLEGTDQLLASDQERIVRLLEKPDRFWQARLQGTLLEKRNLALSQEFIVPAGKEGELEISYVRQESKYWVAVFLLGLGIAAVIALPLGGRKKYE